MVYCEVCHEELSREAKTAEKVAHTPEEIPATAATCTEAGSSEGIRCSVCGEILEGHVEIPVLGHEWDEGTITKEATCTEEGIKTFTCKNNAAHTRTEKISALWHEWDEGTIAKEATCTEEGIKTFTCKNDVTHTKTEKITALGHDWDDGSVIKAATTDNEGEERRICKRDPSHVEIRPIAVLPKSDAFEEDIYGNVALPLTQKEQQILTQKNDNDPAGSTYSLLKAQAKKVSTNSITVTWKRVTGASEYIVYGNKCGPGKHFKKIKTVKGTSYTQKKLKKGTYYKYLVVAVGNGKALATSKTIHAATAGGKFGNSKSVKVNKGTVTLKPKQTFRIKASAVVQAPKLKVSRHRKLAYESSNPKIATVTNKGVIKAVKAGRCKIYVYAQNGVMKAINVMVKK